MQTVGPITLVLNTLQTQRDPAQTLGMTSAAVQVQNASVFVLQIVSAGNLYNLQPFVAQTIPVSGQAITILPTANPGAGTTPTVCYLVWLLKGETPPEQDGQLTAAAITAAISASAALSLATARELISASVTVDNTARQLSFTSSKAYQSFAVFIGNVTSPHIIKGNLNNTNTSLTSANQNFNTVAPAFFTMPCSAGDVIVLTYIADAVLPNNTFFVIGLNTSVPGGLVRPLMGTDQKPLPVGAKSAEHSAAANADVVAAPGANLSILVHTMTIEVDAGAVGGAATLQVTVGGATVNILRVSIGASTGGGATDSLSPLPWGILCDTNTPVHATTSGITYDTSVIYDIV